MTRTGELEGLYSAIEEAAGLLDVAPSHDKVWPILTAYGDTVPQAVIAFRVATRSAGDLDCRFTSLPKDVDPYALALSNGLATETDHPVGALLSDIRERFRIHCHGIDFGVVGGFKKTWAMFPLDNLQELSRLADIPSMPHSLAENISFYARHDLDKKVSMIGIDYPSRTVNIYFLAPAECREPETVRSMLHEFGLPDPSEQMLKLAKQSSGFYTTLSWDSSKVERITFAVIITDVRALPTRFEVESKIEKFATSVSYTYDAADPKGIYGVTSYTGGEYYKLQAYYQLSDGSAEAGGFLGHGGIPSVVVPDSSQ